MNSQLCPSCHAALTPSQWLCPQCGTEVPGVDVERTVMRPAVTEPTSSPLSSTAGLITSVPKSGGMRPPGSPSTASPTWSPIASTQVPTEHSAQPVLVAPDHAAGGIGVPTRDSSQRWLPRAAVALAILGVGLFVWMLTRSDDSATSATAGTLATNDVDTTVEVTVATTVPVTDPPVTSPPRPPWLPPQVPEPPVFGGPGMAWSVSDPLASGMNKDQPTPYLLFAQDVFNKVAADDWAGVQPLFGFQLSDGQVVPYAFELQNQWPAADRLSLILIDAAPDTTGLTGYDLTVAVVANFPAVSSVLCGHLYSDPITSLQVVQRGQFVLMADGVPPVMPETLLNDPAQIEFLKGCK